MCHSILILLIGSLISATAHAWGAKSEVLACRSKSVILTLSAQVAEADGYMDGKIHLSVGESLLSPEVKRERTDKSLSSRKTGYPDYDFPNRITLWDQKTAINLGIIIRGKTWENVTEADLVEFYISKQGGPEKKEIARCEVLEEGSDPDARAVRWFDSHSTAAKFACRRLCRQMKEKSELKKGMSLQQCFQRTCQ